MASQSAKCPLSGLALKKLHESTQWESRGVQLVDSYFNYTWPTTRPCSHLLYPSKQMFVDHLLWFCKHYTTCGDYQYHAYIFDVLLKHRPLCSCCRNMMILSPDSITEVFSAKPPSHPKNDRVDPRYTLYTRLFDHPQIHKVMMKICRKSMPTFHSMCISLNNVNTMVRRRCEEMDIGWTRALLRYSDMVCLSVKYWRRKHILYFMNKHYNVIDVLGCDIDLGRELMATGVSRNEMTSIPAIAHEAILKIRQYDIKQYFDDMYVMIEKLDRKGGLRRIVRNEVKQRVLCSFMQCSRQQKDSRESFKLCAGCKLTYYCCRSCQKKAWSQHKSICLKLRRLYAL